MADLMKARAFLAATAIFGTLGTGAHGQGDVTDPVGYITNFIKGTGGLTDKVENLTTISLVNATEASGVVSGIVGNRISVVDAAAWTADQFNSPTGSHYIEVRSGAAFGLILDIVGTGESFLDVARLPDGLLAPGDIIFIRSNYTVESLFGDGIGFIVDGDGFLSGTSPMTSDNVVLLDPETKAQQVFYVHEDGDTLEWREAGIAGDAGASLVPFPLGVMIVRRGTEDLSIINVGHVPFYTEGGDFTTFLPVWPGQNFLSMPLNAATLDTSGMYSPTSSFSVVPGADPTEADVLVLNSGPDRFEPAYYRTGEGWRRVGVDGDAGDWDFPLSSSARYHRNGPPGWVKFKTGFIPSAEARIAPPEVTVAPGTTITPTDGALVVSWPTDEGTQYQIQTKPPIGGDWTGLPEIYTGDGTTASTTRAPKNGGEYFRVIKTQGK